MKKDVCAEAKMSGKRVRRSAGGGMLVGGREFGDGSGIVAGVGTWKPLGLGLEEETGAAAGVVGIRSSQSSSKPSGWPIGFELIVRALGAGALEVRLFGGVFAEDGCVAPNAGCGAPDFEANLAVVLFFQSSCLDVGATEVSGSDTSNSPRSASMLSAVADAGGAFCAGFDGCGVCGGKEAEAG